MARPPIFAELLPFKFGPLNKYIHIKKYHKLLFGGYHVSRIFFYSISRGEQSCAGYWEWASHEITRVAMCKNTNREWTSARSTDLQWDEETRQSRAENGLALTSGFSCFSGGPFWRWQRLGRWAARARARRRPEVSCPPPPAWPGAGPLPPAAPWPVWWNWSLGKKHKQLCVGVRREFRMKRQNFSAPVNVR